MIYIRVPRYFLSLGGFGLRSRLFLGRTTLVRGLVQFSGGLSLVPFPLTSFLVDDSCTFTHTLVLGLDVESEGRQVTGPLCIGDCDLS